ncbi:hypothetical protein [Nocardia nova]|uniref:hypothetical protein n=1 Tax=Nocardia nova TaxID=37330 RepID=UPI0011B0ABCA|nr:hypothetical protein [Nocardia nova]
MFARVPGEHDWYTGQLAGQAIRMRRNTMPGDNPYSVHLGADRFLELAALPPSWILPETAAATL